jgi:hypothetical protein
LQSTLSINKKQQQRQQAQESNNDILVDISTQEDGNKVDKHDLPKGWSHSYGSSASLLASYSILTSFYF